MSFIIPQTPNLRERPLTLVVLNDGKTILFFYKNNSKLSLHTCP